MGNWGAALLALGGAGQGVARGIGEITEQQRQAEALAQQEKHQSALEALTKGSQDETHRHYLVEEGQVASQQEEKRLSDFITNSQHLGINFVNPKQAMSALQAADISSGFYKNAEMAGASALKGNLPRAFVSGSESLGGAYAEGKQFSPYEAQGAYERNKIAQDRQYQVAISAARGRIEKAYADGMASFARDNGVSDITKMVGDPAMAQVRQRAETFAAEQRTRAALAEHNMLRTQFPDRMMGVTPSMLTGMEEPTAPSASNGTASASPRVTQPGVSAPPSLNFDPSDPLGIRAGRKAPPTPVAPATSPRSSSNDPLGIYGRP